MIVWKILRRHAGKLYSAVVRKPIALNYEIDKTSVPRYGYIMAFDNEIDARNWMQPYRDCVLVSAEAELATRTYRVSKHPLKATSIDFLHKGGLKALSTYWKDPKPCPKMTLPRGTVFCKSLRPLAILTTK